MYYTYMQVSTRASGGPAEGQGRRVIAAGPGRHPGEPRYVCLHIYVCILILCTLLSV